MTFQDSLSFSHKPLFYTDAKGISAFRACTAVFSRNTGKTDLYTAIRTFFIYVGFAIFPFVTAQKKPFFDFFAYMQICLIFLCTFCNIFGKHTVKHQKTEYKRNEIDDYFCRSADKKHNNCQCYIYGKHTFCKCIRSISAVEKRR